MQITYIGHSGFLVELSESLLLFDYYEGSENFFSGRGASGYSLFLIPRHLGKPGAKGPSLSDDTLKARGEP